MDFVYTEFELNKVMEELEQSLRLKLSTEKEVTLTLTTPQSECYIYAERNRRAQDWNFLSAKPSFSTWEAKSAYTPSRTKALRFGLPFLIILFKHYTAMSHNNVSIKQS